MIETKTYSKPASGRATINYDGQQILVNGKATYKDIIVQVSAATSYIKKVLKDSTGKEFEPFLWFFSLADLLKRTAIAMRQLWVLGPKRLRSFWTGRQ